MSDITPPAEAAARKEAIRLLNAGQWKAGLKPKFFGIPCFLINLRARIRAAFGFCPQCNSDAPELYDCWVCRGYTWNKDGVPTRDTKRNWINRYNTGEDIHV